MRNLVVMVFAGFLMCCAASGAVAQSYPSRSIRLIVPFASGGPIDLLSRTIAGKLAEVIGQSVVVENRAGAGGSIAAEHTARSAPDGHTIMLITVGTQGINPALFPRVGYDPLKDFTYITTIGGYALMLVANPNLEAKTLAELIALARARPGTINFGSGGVGSSSHLAGELFKSTAGLQMQHVPYKGSAAAMTDVIAGNLAFLFDVVSTAQPQIRAGKVRALAWSGVRRSLLFPEVPTMAEAALPGFDITGWVGMGAPAGLPKQVLDRLHEALAKAIATPELRDALVAQGYDINVITPEAFSALVRIDVAKWGKVVRDSGARAE